MAAPRCELMNEKKIEIPNLIDSKVFKNQLLVVPFRISN